MEKRDWVFVWESVTGYLCHTSQVKWPTNVKGIFFSFAQARNRFARKSTTYNIIADVTPRAIRKMPTMKNTAAMS